MLKLILFVAFSTALVYVSRASLRAPRSHGFYRFFAWESILSLFFLNFENFTQWFRDPFSIRQLVSWFLLVTSLVPLVLGVYQLRTQGRPDTQRRGDVPLIGIEKTTQLITTGVFKYIRHPLYSSLFLLAWGVFFKDPSWAGSCLALGATAFLLAMVKVEEEENIRYFGPAYKAYMQETKMFIPFFF
jgi:protein-S-isoprenylcysteine O-methyltransferase Ste14